jgi:exosortase
MSDQSQLAPQAPASVWQEIANFWRQMPDKGLFLAMLAAWTVVFHFWGNPTFGVFGRPTPSLFEWMYLVFRTSEDDAHGLFVLPAVLVLLFVKRKELLAPPKRLWWPALGLFVAAVVLHIGGYVVQQPRISIAAYFLGVYGLTGLVWGRSWLQASFFPMFLFVFCIPLSAVSEIVTFPLRILVSKISVFISATFLGIPVIRDGVQVFSPTGGFRYEVAAACSGIRSLISLLALTLIYGFLSFRSPWRKLLMVASCVPLAILGNVLRLTTVILVGEAFGQQAGMMIETKFGFVTFALALLGVFLLGWWLSERPRHQAAGQEVAA